MQVVELRFDFDSLGDQPGVIDGKHILEQAVQMQLDALARIMERTTAPQDRQVLLDQAAMIERLSAGTVDEPSDRADISRAYQRVVSISEALAVAAS